MSLRAWGKSLLIVQCLAFGSIWAQPAAPDALRAQFAAVREKGEGNIVDRSVYLQSTEASGRMQGDVYALIDHPYGDLRHALTQADHWCGILILHLNVKYCRASNTGTHDELVTGVGRKFDQPLSDVYWVRFDFRVSSASDGYLHVVLQAPTGPLSTNDYRIVVEAIPFAGSQSLLHMTYSYSYGLAAHWAMKAYLATIGSDKLGLSVVGQRADGQPIHVGGVRGVLERNTLRYYLAIDSYVEAHAQPGAEQLQRSLQIWFSATERYAKQLHEIDRNAYVDMKLREVRRQETVEPPRSIK
jgi:hypothetical protein